MDDTKASPSARIESVDIVRGVVMLLMAIDHVRVYAGVPPGSSTSAWLFLTRWVTHFCVPAFVFLGGASAFLHGRKLGNPAALSKFLVTRGLVLVLLELTVLRFFWTFNFDYANYSLAGVIWMLGWCMVVLAGLIRLPWAAIVTVGAAIVAGHNLTDNVFAAVGPAAEQSGIAWLWQILYFGGQINVLGFPVAILYSLLPWAGLMALGYAFGRVLVLPAEARVRWCLRLGALATVLFLVLRAANGYGDPRPWSGERGPAWISFLGTTKYPGSLDFLLMTMGPVLLALGAIDRAGGLIGRALALFGRVPMFYYLLHIPLIHLIFVGLSVVRFGAVIPWMTANHPMNPGPPPDGYPYGLPALYAVTALVKIGRAHV
jgi:uncharacterized membrane protein